ncbi:MAG: hypothetical protein H8E51_00890 [Bacteroidetes bacterium]|nr:hypothetical protein [Bacteroidota bacterium]
MKKLLFSFGLVCFALYLNGQYFGSISTQQSDLTFSTKDGFDIVELNEKHFINQIGEPQLPVKIFSYVLPIDAKDVTVNVTNTSSLQITSTYLIYPAQPPSVPDGNPPPAFIPPSEDIYNSSNPYPGKIVEITDVSCLMGYKIVSITIYPIEYIPINQVVYLYSSIDFVINYTLGADPIQFPVCMSKFRKQAVKEKIKILVDNDSDIENYSSEFNNIPEDGSLLNLPIQEQYPGNLGIIPDYLIITTQSLKQVFIDEVIKEKNRNGMPAIIATLEEDIIGKYNGCDTAEQIRNFILKLTLNIGPHLYILIGGDVNLIPARFCYISGQIAPTDLYYSAEPGPWNNNGNSIFGQSKDGPGGGHVDDLPQHILGRLPARNEDDIIRYVEKMEEYRNLQ